MSKSRKTKADGVYRRDDSRYWWASYTDADGKRTRRSTGTKKRKEAEAILAKWKLETFQDKQWGVSVYPDFDEVLLRYVKQRNHENRPLSQPERTAANRLLEDLSGTSSATTIAAVRGIIDSHIAQGRSAGTINKFLVMWSAAINQYNRDMEMDIPNPVSGQKLQEPESIVRWITHEEAARLITETQSPEASPILHDSVQISLQTGMRRTETLGLLVTEIDIVGRSFNPGRRSTSRKKKRRTKSGKGRTIPMTDVAVEIVRRRLKYRAQNCPESPYLFTREDGTPYRDLKKGFKGALKRAGINDFRWHDLRHTFASWLVQEGVSLQEVKELLGHASIKQTEIYAHLAPEQLRRAVIKLPNLSHDSVTVDKKLKIVKK